MEKAPVFEKILADYLKQVAGIDVSERAEILGIQVEDGRAVIPFFGRTYRVSGAGIVEERESEPERFLRDHSIGVVLCRYLLLCPPRLPEETDWTAFRDFRDAAPFVGGFLNTAEKPIAKLFAGRLEEMEAACNRMGARDPEEQFPYQLCRVVPALPRIPLLLLFNDRDEEFPAQCKVLFERRAEKFLDMECLAILGMLLPGRLNEKR